MSDSIKVIRKSEQATSTWSGGTTTQLAIYPQDADYLERNFTWRISSAKVEVEQSLFTPLPGFWRLLMIIEGEMTLEHEGHHCVTVKPFEQDGFSGGWNTRSIGTATDFNLMVAEGCRGFLEAIHIKQDMPHEHISNRDLLDFELSFEAFYCVHGVVAITVNDNESVEVGEGDLLLVSDTAKETRIKLVSKGEEASSVIRASVLGTSRGTF